MDVKVSSGSPYELSIGISRARRIGPIIAVSGTAPLGADGKTVHAGDLYAQTKRCLEISLAAVVQAGGKLEHVTRTRVLLTDMTRWQEAARAHGEMFGEHRPANAFVEVSRFIDSQWLVETEIDAYVSP
jgi:enamine deaminase RidA (YjgF/YER057c/UK114 family)